MCRALLKCGNLEEPDCKDLEESSLVFLDYLTDDAAANTKQAFPMLGHEGQQGSVSDTVSQGTAFRKTRAGVVLITVATVVGIVSLLLGAVSFVVFRSRTK